MTEIAFLNQKLSSISYNTFNVANNYRVLERRIKNIQDAKELRDLQEYVKNSCELIVVATNNISEAFQFFDSQNTRGKKLYPHDLLKAYHLREMNSFEISETEEIVKNGKSWIGRNFRICFKSTYIV